MSDCQLKRAVGHYKWKQHSVRLMKGVQNDWIQESRLNCSGYIIHAKAMEITRIV